MRRVTLLSRPGCHLCEDALAVLEQVSQIITFKLEIQNIDEIALLYDKYKNDIPVILLDGEEVGRHRIQKDEIMKILNRAP